MRQAAAAAVTGVNNKFIIVVTNISIQCGACQWYIRSRTWHPVCFPRALLLTRDHGRQVAQSLFNSLAVQNKQTWWQENGYVCGELLEIGLRLSSMPSKCQRRNMFTNCLLRLFLSDFCSTLVFLVFYLFFSISQRVQVNVYKYGHQSRYYIAKQGTQLIRTLNFNNIV